MGDTILLRVDKEDVNRMMTTGKELFLKEHPEMKGMVFTRRFMFKKIVNNVVGDE